jgi:hypothetical protein
MHHTKEAAQLVRVAVELVGELWLTVACISALLFSSDSTRQRNSSWQH